MATKTSARNAYRKIKPIVVLKPDAIRIILRNKTVDISLVDEAVREAVRHE